MNSFGEVKPFGKASGSGRVTGGECKDREVMLSTAGKAWTWSTPSAFIHGDCRGGELEVGNAYSSTSRWIQR